MGKNPSVKDYAGHCYDRGRRFRVKLDKESTISMKCLDCQTRRYVTHAESRRAALPKCLKCGGILSETAAYLDRTKASRRRLERVEAIKCKACGKKFTQLANHLRGDADCREYYRLEDELIAHPRGQILKGTVNVQHVRSKWRVFGVTVNGNAVELEALGTKSAAEERAGRIEQGRWTAEARRQAGEMEELGATIRMLERTLGRVPESG